MNDTTTISEPYGYGKPRSHVMNTYQERYRTMPTRHLMQELRTAALEVVDPKLHALMMEAAERVMEMMHA